VSPEQARRLATELAGCYPSANLATLHLSQWTDALLAVPFVVGQAAVGKLAVSFPNWPPTKGQVAEAIRMATPVERELPWRAAGRPLESYEIAHGFHHLRRYWEQDRSDPAELEMAQEPWACKCGWSA